MEDTLVFRFEFASSKKEQVVYTEAASAKNLLTTLCSQVVVANGVILEKPRDRDEASHFALVFG